MTERAMSGTAWDGGWAALSNLDELLFFKDNLDNKEVNDPALKLTKHEIAQKVLLDIEDLGRNSTNDWLDELPIFDEFQTLAPVDLDSAKVDDCSFKFEQQQLSPSDGSIVPSPETQKKPPASKDLFSVSYENAATFILSDENIVYINSDSFASLDPLQPECIKNIEYDEKTLWEEAQNENPKNAVPEADPPQDVKTELAVVDEIIRNTAMELDQWESDTTQSETSSDGTSATDLSSKEKEEETDDPDWKPMSSDSAGKRSGKRAKPYWRGGSQEEKRLRKKEQNKNAATRYRQKKKAEIHEILKEEELLRKKNAKLKETVADMEHERKCVRAFVRDYFKAKGMIVD